MRKASKKKILFRSKPTFGYYLLAVSFPIMFFLPDNSPSFLFEAWEWNIETIGKLSFLLLCFGIPIIILALRTELLIFEDRIEVKKRAIKKSQNYSFMDLTKWKYVSQYLPGAGGQQEYLTIRFDKKKISIHSLESNSFEQLRCFFEDNHPSKKHNHITLIDRLRGCLTKK